MEWKWVKNLLIVLFLILNCFLIYKVYEKNSTNVLKPETIQALDDFLNSKNITCNFKLENVQTKKYMKKINISNDENIEEKFLPLSGLDNNVTYSGRNREIIPISSVIANFIRETKLTNVKIDNVLLGYYPEINQIDSNVLAGEATPAWLICLENGENYIYNAYTSNIIKKLD